MSLKATAVLASPLRAQNFELLRSRTLKFIIGAEKIEFHVHPGFVAGHSILLNDLVSRASEEGSEGCLIWENVNHGVFLRFLEFTYMRDYTCETTAATEQEKSNINVPPTTEESEKLNFSYSLVSCSQAADTATLSCAHNVEERVGKKRKIGDVLCDCQLIQARKRTISDFTAKYITAAAPTVLPKKTVQRPVEYFVEHVKVWLFAHKYAINPLMDLASAKFAHDLAEWEITNYSFVTEFGGLVRCLYATTDTRSQLRQILSDFGACVLDDVAALDGWRALLKEVPAFTMDLLDSVVDQRVYKRRLTRASEPGLFGRALTHNIFAAAAKQQYFA
ncbi:3-oxoacyl-reductase [Apiospora arundinis]